MPALPATIAIALAEAGYVTAAVIVANITIGQIITAALVVNGIVRARKARRAGSAVEQNLKDRILTIRTAVAPREIVYGRARIGCVFIRKPFTTGEHSELLHVNLALRAGHTLDAIEDIWFDGESIGPLDVNGNVTGGRYFKVRTEQVSESHVIPPSNQVTLARAPSKVDTVAAMDFSAPSDDNGTSYQLVQPTSVSGAIVTLPPGHAGKTVTVTYQHETGTPMVRVRRWLGLPQGERDEWLEAISGGLWKPTHLGCNVPRLHIVLAYDPDIFPTGLPEVTAVVRGKRVLDTRTGATTWSRNYALCAHDYLVDSELGFGEDPAYVNIAETNAAANISDEMVRLPGFPPRFQERYTCDGMLSTAESRLDNLAMLATAAVGNVVYTGGEWLIRAGAYSEPVMDLTDDDLAEGAIELTTETPTRDAFNSVRGKIIDPMRGYQEVEFPPYESSVYIAEDGEKIYQDVTLPMTADNERAQRIAKMILHLSRQSVGLAATFADKAARVRPGETVRLTIGIFGHEQKTFRVVDRKFRFPGAVWLALKETSPEPYAWNYEEAKGYDPTPNSTLPRPWFVPALDNMQVASGPTYTRLMKDGSRQAYMRVTWDRTDDIGVLQGGKIECYVKRALDLEYDQFEVDGADVAFDYDVADEETYNVAIRARNGAGARGNYTIATHTVVNAFVAPQGINYLGEFASHPATGLTEGAIYRNSVTKDTYIYSAGVWSVFLESGEDGAPGTAKLLDLKATSEVFAVSTSGVGSPASIVLTAQGQNLEGSPVFSVTAGTVTGNLLGSGTTRTLNFAAMATRSVTVRAEQDGQADEVTIVKLFDGASGADAINALLTNESHTLAAAPDGAVESYASASARLKIYEGTAEVTAGWTISKVDSPGLVSTLTATGADRGLLQVQSMAEDSGFVILTATRPGYPTQEKRFVIAKSKQGRIGPSGTSAKLLVLNADPPLLHVSQTGALTPASITFKAGSQNLTGAPVFEVIAGVGTLAGTGTSRTMAASSMTTDSVTVRVSQDGQADETTVIKLREGSDAVSARLTNEAHTVSADSAGVVPASNWPITTDMDVFIGLVDDTPNWSFSIAGAQFIATVNNTPGSPDRGRVTITGMTGDTGSLSIHADKPGYPTQKKVFTLSKSRQGTGGLPGLNGVRGSAHVYLSGYGAWNQVPVDNYFASTYSGKVLNDVVTVYGGNFSQTRLWNGSAWVQVQVALDGSLVVVGSMPGDRVTQGSLTGDRNKTPPVGALASITPDPGFEDLTLWDLSGSAVRVVNGSWAKSGRYSIYGDGRFGARDSATVQSKWVPVDRGTQYLATANLTSHAGNRTSYLYVAFLRADMNLASGGVAGWPAAYGANRYFGRVNQNPGGIEVPYSIQFGPGTGVEIPPDAAFMAIGCLLHYDDGLDRWGNNSVSGLRINKVAGTELIAPNAATDVLIATNAGSYPAHAGAPVNVCALWVSNPSPRAADLTVTGNVNLFPSAAFESGVHCWVAISGAGLAQNGEAQGAIAMGRWGSFAVRARGTLAAGASTVITLSVATLDIEGLRPAWRAGQFTGATIKAEVIKA